ncbi:MAG TPA: lysozyme inhibitor LprI family protein, partial [Luteibacter sp.]|nr:lysozyme inhibitor LprI family protein [Luteibacter sp.]
MTIVRLLILLGMGIFASDAFAASFDCSKAASPVEKLICGDQDVSRLDTQLQGTYQTALGAVDASSKDRLVKEQRNWIRYTRNICQDEACLGDAYKARIAVLGRNEKYLVDKASCDIPDGKSCRSVVVYRDPEARIDSFNKSLVEQKISGKIIG